MAANDYYNNNAFSPNGPHGPSSTQHTGTVGASAHPSNQSQQSISPVSSPFDDRNRYDYPSSSQQHLASGGAAPVGYSSYSDTGYHGANNRYDPPAGHGHDPFADQNAIPLQNQGKMGTGPSPYGADPENNLHHGRTGSGFLPEKNKKKKKGLFNGRITWVVYILTTIQISVFIAEIAKSSIMTGSPIMTKPQFNPMIGPSPWVLTNMGARFAPCMHNVEGITNFDGVGINWPCPGAPKDSGECTLSQLCGMGGVPEQPSGKDIDIVKDTKAEPNQWWRFITPIFLHAGLVHIGFNMLLQLTLGRDMEKELGSIRFFLLYFSAGIFGNVLGGNYAAPIEASTGASGALFGVLALVLLDLFYNWSSNRSPVKDLLFLLLDIAIAFVLGLLPGLDNFAHIGGFLMGLALGICLMHSPQVLRQRIGVDDPPYATVDSATSSGAPALSAFVKKPVGFFKGRKPFWWAWWLVRAGALVAVFIGFILLLRNFYEWKQSCSWCHRLSCLPVNGWCNTALPFTTTTQQAAPTPSASASSTLAARAALITARAVLPVQLPV